MHQWRYHIFLNRKRNFCPLELELLGWLRSAGWRKLYQGTMAKRDDVHVIRCLNTFTDSIRTTIYSATFYTIIYPPHLPYPHLPFPRPVLSPSLTPSTICHPHYTLSQSHNVTATSITVIDIVHVYTAPPYSLFFCTRSINSSRFLSA